MFFLLHIYIIYIYIIYIIYYNIFYYKININSLNNNNWILQSRILNLNIHTYVWNMVRKETSANNDKINAWYDTSFKNVCLSINNSNYKRNIFNYVISNVYVRWLTLYKKNSAC